MLEPKGHCQVQLPPPCLFTNLPVQTGSFGDSQGLTEIVFDPNQNCKPSFIQGLAMMPVLVSCPPEGSSP